MVPLPADVVQLLELAARHPEGEAPLYEGHLESVAALYQVRPQTVERLRTCLERPGGRAAAEELLQRARLDYVLDRRASAPHRTPSLPALIARARALPGGVELLTRAPVDAAAIAFQTHPFVVDEARRQLAEEPQRWEQLHFIDA